MSNHDEGVIMSEPTRDQIQAELSAVGINPDELPQQVFGAVVRRLKGQIDHAVAERDAARAENVRLRAENEKVRLVNEGLAEDANHSADEYRKLCGVFAERDRLQSEVDALRSHNNSLADMAAACKGEEAGLVEMLGTAERERDKLREAIRSAGFAVMETSGKWSIHDVSEKAKADEERERQVIVRNVELEVERDRLRAALQLAVNSITAAIKKDDVSAPLSADAHLDEAVRAAELVGVKYTGGKDGDVAKLRGEAAHVLGAVMAENTRLRSTGDAILRHLELTARDGPLNNPAYWEMLAGRMREAGFVAKREGDK